MRWYWVLWTISVTTTLLVVKKKDDEVILGQLELSDGVYRLSNSTVVQGGMDKAYIDPVRQLVYLYSNTTQHVYNTSTLAYYTTLHTQSVASVQAMDWLSNRSVAVYNCSVKGWDTVWTFPDCYTNSSTPHLVVDSLHSEAFLSLYTTLYKFSKTGSTVLSVFEEEIQALTVDSLKGEVYILSGEGNSTLLSVLTSNGHQAYTNGAANATGLVLLNNTLHLITNTSDVQAVPSLVIPWGSGDILATFSAQDAQLCEVKLSHNATNIRGEWYYLEGSPLKVSCFVVGPSTLRLTQDGVLRKESRVSSIYGVRSVSTSSASSQQAGLYTCRCERGVSSDEVSVRLNVLKLRLEVQTEVIEARPGDQVQFTCTGTSSTFLDDLQTSHPSDNLTQRICSCGSHTCYGCSSCAPVCRGCEDECVSVDHMAGVMGERGFTRECVMTSHGFSRTASLTVPMDYRSPSSWFLAMLVGSTIAVCSVGAILLVLRYRNSKRQRHVLPDNGVVLPVFTLDNLIMKGSISAGSFSDIVSAQIRYQKDDNTVLQEVVVKVFKDSSELDIVNELRMMKLLKHRHVLEIIGLYQVKAQCNLVLPVMANGDLKAWLVQRKQLKLETALEDKISFLAQAVKGVGFMFKHNIVHRDLAARNMMLTEHNVLKIGDFGLARKLNKKGLYRRRSNVRLPVKYISPEAWVNRLFSCQSDIWCFGVLIWEVMADGEMPYKSVPSAEIKHFVCDLHQRLERPEGCPHVLYKLMSRCWSPIPANRPSIKELFEQVSVVKDSRLGSSNLGSISSHNPGSISSHNPGSISSSRHSSINSGNRDTLVVRNKFADDRSVSDISIDGAVNIIVEPEYLDLPDRTGSRMGGSERTVSRMVKSCSHDDSERTVSRMVKSCSHDDISDIDGGSSRMGNSVGVKIDDISMQSVAGGVKDVRGNLERSVRENRSVRNNMHFEYVCQY